MRKIAILVGALAPIVLFNTGCVSGKQPEIKNENKQEVEIIERTIKKEIIIPHNKEIKKAVVILVKKMNKIENSLGEHTAIKDKQEIIQNSLRDVLMKNQEHGKAISTQAQKLKDIDKRISMLRSTSITQKNTSNDAGKVIQSTYQYEATEYDKIIKDFAEGSLK